MQDLLYGVLKVQKFVFKLEPLLEYRKRMEELFRRDFLEAGRMLEEEEGKLETLRDAYQKSVYELDRLKEEGGGTTELNLHYNYINSLKHYIEEQKKIVNELRAAYELKRKELVESSKAKKTVELVKERSLESYRVEANRAEQKDTDEIAALRFARNKKDGV